MALTLSAFSGVALATELPQVSFCRLDGVGAKETRLLLMPSEALGEIRFHRGRLDELGFGLGSELALALMGLRGYSTKVLPPSLHSVSVLFGASGGLFRWQGSFEEESLDPFLKARKLERIPSADGAFLEHPELWAVEYPNLIYGGWGERVERLRLVGLDGRGRRLHRLRASRARELLDYGRTPEEGAGPDLAALMNLDPAEIPYHFRRFGFRIEVDPDRPGRFRLRAQLELVDTSHRREVQEWVSLLWKGNQDLRTRSQGKQVLIQWVENPESLIPKLEGFREGLFRWLDSEPLHPKDS